MKSTLKLIPTTGMNRDEWLAYRHQGIGASEVGAIMGLDDYLSSLELYYYKIGEVPKFDTESMASFMGREQEDLIARLWQYWENDEATMIKNFRAARIVRKCQRVNAYIHNPEFPWLFVSLDRKINTTSGKSEGTLELKTIGGYEADKWESGLPPKWVTQVQTQMGVCAFTWGEMATLQDGRRMNVLPFDFSPNIFQHVVTKTGDFWKRVVEGRKLVNEKYAALVNYNQRRADECTHEIDKLAPEPDGSLAYADFLRQRYNRPSSAERDGTPAELLIAIQQRQAAERLKEIQEEKLLHENTLKRAMGDSVQILNFGRDGKVYWSQASNGARIFRNKIKQL